MDGFVCAGPRRQMKALRARLQDSLDVTGVVVFGGEGVQKVQILGHVLEQTAIGVRLGVSPELVNNILKDEGLDGGGRSTVTPGVNMTTEQRDDDELQAPVDDELHKHFRTQVVILLLLAQVRPDLQHAVMRLSRKVSGPYLWDVRALRRCVRYISGTGSRGLIIQPTTHWALDGFADADLAGDVQYMKSCS